MPHKSSGSSPGITSEILITAGVHLKRRWLSLSAERRAETHALFHLALQALALLIIWTLSPPAFQLFSSPPPRWKCEHAHESSPSRVEISPWRVYIRISDKVCAPPSIWLTGIYSRKFIRTQDISIFPRLDPKKQPSHPSAETLCVRPESENSPGIRLNITQSATRSSVHARGAAPGNFMLTFAWNFDGAARDTLRLFESDCAH